MRPISGTGSGLAAGFTLLELMVVLAVIALVSAAIPSAFNRAIPSRRLDATMEAIAGVIREAQLSSAVQGRRLALALTSSSLSLNGGGRAARVEWPRSIQVTLRNVSGTPKELRVYPDGSSDEMLFEVTDGKNVGELQVSALTGRITHRRTS